MTIFREQSTSASAGFHARPLSLFENVGFGGSKKTGEPVGTRHQAEPGPRLWKTSALNCAIPTLPDSWRLGFIG